MNRLRRLSITARITIGSLIVATLFGLVAVEVVRFGVASILHNATVTLLDNDVAAPAAALGNNPSGPFDLPGGGQELAIVDASGAVLASTLPGSLEADIGGLLRLGEQAASVKVGDDQYLVLVRAVSTRNGVMHVVAARNNETTDLILDRLTGALAIGAVLLVIGFGAASWLLTRAALRPVSRMREQAERIAGVQSTGLLTVNPARDELAELAGTLNELIRRLRASAERERQMVSDASHELRTPLAVLRGQLELAELDAGDAEALLADIRSSRSTALRLGQLANNLLELSRIEAGPASGRTDWRTLTDELADAIDRARLLAASPEENTPPISIDFDYNPRKTPPGDGLVGLSPTDFGRILDNLIGNAITAIAGASGGAGDAPARAGDAAADAATEPETGATTPPDPTTPDALTPRDATVTAELTATDAEVILTVRDTGPGMPADFIPVALDRFTRADGARTAHSGGGLGLAIVGALAGSAGGSVVLANAEGGGLVVTVVLPLVGAPSPVKAEQ
ncbi:HAMP domain-containing sensor histidine kinase [Leifsonia sp. PS1209]|uniref:sensor histidine kinase n=1 Tax=Leifsonia sp. PS1209 TaxID=2724914 RepID=UPI001442C6BE|nr:HAMP domain-containing sensor histidine kinase [Leifsonia sp. PS1209]QIZ97298.1 HAMP domain-containing histidine kinase [Leifsonia sp. PS1209]